MQYNFYFDICALYILATIAITSLSRRRVPAYRQRAYGALFFVVFLSTISERIETLLQMFPQDAAWYPYAEQFWGSIYFLSHLGTGMCYLLYIMALLDIYFDDRSVKGFFRSYFPYTIGLLMVFINLFKPILFHYSEDGLYHRDRYLFVYYILAAYYIFYGFILIYRYNSLMRLRTKLIVSAYVVFSVVGIGIQFFFPTVLVENLFNTISVTLVYITLQNPSEMIDEQMNILNRRAFFEGLDLKIKRNSPHVTIFVTIDNIRTLSSEIGYDQGQKVLKKIAKYLKRAGFREYGLYTYTYRYSEYVFAITIHSLDDNKVQGLLQAVADRLSKPWNFGGMTIRVESHSFLMKYPTHFSSIAEFMNRLELIVGSITPNQEAVIDVDTIDVSKVKRARDYDDLAGRNLEEKKALIKFQPVLSRKYKINYIADAVCFFIDEYGNEVDMRGHIPDVQITQALMDTDEFVYRGAARALAFWNGGDKNGKYTAIVTVSQGEISKTDFIRRIKKILREERAEAKWIMLKLTETTVTTMNSVAERNIRLLGDMNVSVIIDKFGSGYGNLERILSLPIVQINIAHDILVKTIDSPRMKTVAQGMVNLFHDISVFVGAENIESEEERRAAEEIGCDFLMGDFLGRPMKDSSFVKVIDDYFEEG